MRTALMPKSSWRKRDPEVTAPWPMKPTTGQPRRLSQVAAFRGNYAPRLSGTARSVLAVVTRAVGIRSSRRKQPPRGFALWARPPPPLLQARRTGGVSSPRRPRRSVEYETDLLEFHSRRCVLPLNGARTRPPTGGRTPRRERSRLSGHGRSRLFARVGLASHHRHLRSTTSPWLIRVAASRPTTAREFAPRPLRPCPFLGSPTRRDGSRCCGSRFGTPNPTCGTPPSGHGVCCAPQIGDPVIELLADRPASFPWRSARSLRGLVPAETRSSPGKVAYVRGNAARPAHRLEPQHRLDRPWASVTAKDAGDHQRF